MGQTPKATTLLIKFYTLVFSILVSQAALADFRFFQNEQTKNNLAGGPPVVATEGQYSQAVDHFSASVRIFPQRYWFSKTMAKGSSSPVLVYICGESSCGAGVLYGPISAHARFVGAYLFALEHRYYGKSQPFSDLSSKNLEFLSTEQAIEDLRDFKKAMQTQYGLRGPWILVGGSYAGNLAAYARTRYPQDFLGALASSAPVNATLEFTQFDREMAEIAGRECAETTQKILHQVESRIQTAEGFEEMKVLFAVPAIAIKRDFLELLSDITSASMLYGFKQEFCQTLSDKGVSGYAFMKKKIDFKVGDFAKYATKNSEDVSLAAHTKGMGMRQWYYQQCTEYGFWQNSNPGFSMRSKYLNMQAQDQLCQRLFGQARASLPDLIDQKFFNPLLNMQHANIFMTNGSLDPWRHLSITNAEDLKNSSGIELKMMTGALHCDDITSAGNTEVMATKERFRSLLKLWIENQ